MAHAVGLPFELHEPAVVDDAVDDRRHLVVSEDLEHEARLRPGGEARGRGGPLQPLHRGPLPALAAGDGPLGRPGARLAREGVQLTDAMARSLEREAMYAVVIDPLSGYDTGTPSGWIATNALMAASDPRFADEFWEAIDGRGGLVRR